jgi:hypothetical protein
MLTISTRPLTADEAESLKKAVGLRSLLGNLMITIVLFGAIGTFGGLFCAWIVGLLLQWAAPHQAVALLRNYLQLGLAVGGALFMVGSGTGTVLQMRRLDREDQERGEAQILHVKDPIIVQQDVYNDEGPILYFDMGEGKILFLWGQWLLDAETYGAAVEELPEDLDVPEHLNGLPDPYAFPNSEFKITRMPRSGKVLRIEVLGTYLPPTRTIGRKEVRIHVLGPSAILSGSLDSLQRAMSANKDQP